VFIFIFCGVGIFLLVAQTREYLKAKFKKQDQLLQSMGGEQTYDNRKITLECSTESARKVTPSSSESTPEVDDIIVIEAAKEADVLDDSDVHVPRKTSIGYFASLPGHTRAQTFDDTMRSISFNIHADGIQTKRRSTAHHSRSQSYANPGNRKAMALREAERARRKSVIKIMKFGQSPRKLPVVVETDRDGDVNVSVETQMSVLTPRTESRMFFPPSEFEKEVNA